MNQPVQQSKNAPALRPIDEIRATLNSKGMQEQIKSALPKGVSVERFARILITALQQTPALLKCERASLWAAAMRCAQDGLLPDGREAALVEFKGNVQYLPMYQGLLKKARNSKEIKTITAEAIYEHDEFDYQLGDSPKIYHKPPWGDDRGKLLGAYCVIETKDGGIYRKVMSKGDIDKVKAVSRSSNSQHSPWTNWYDRMAVKTVLKACLKLAPSSTDMDGFDNDDYDRDQDRPSASVAQAEQRKPKVFDTVVQQAQEGGSIDHDADGEVIASEGHGQDEGMDRMEQG